MARNKGEQVVLSFHDVELFSSFLGLNTMFHYLNETYNVQCHLCAKLESKSVGS